MKFTCFANTGIKKQNPLKHVESIRSIKNLVLHKEKLLIYPGLSLMLLIIYGCRGLISEGAPPESMICICCLG